MNSYEGGAKDLKQPQQQHLSAQSFPSSKQDLYQSHIAAQRLQAQSTHPSRPAYPQQQSAMLTFNQQPQQHHLNNQYPQRMPSGPSVKKPELLQSSTPLANGSNPQMHSAQQQQHQQQQLILQQQIQHKQQQQQQQQQQHQQQQQQQQQQTQQQQAHHHQQHHLQQQHPYQQQRQFGSFEAPSPPTPSPSPGNHPTILIPHAKLHQLDMSQNSPNGDPASSPNLSASSPTSTTSKKRTRASVEQLAILEDTFLTNQSPNSKVREILAKKVKMSERSIQIWFQNRRAKVKQAQKRSELVQQEAMKAQYLSNCAAAGITPQAIYGFAAPASGGKAFPMAGHLHPSALARAPLSRANSYDPSRSSAVQARFAQTGLGINVPGAPNAGMWNPQAPYGMQPQVHPGFAFRPSVPQAMSATRGVKRSFDGANGPLAPGAVPKPLHFPGAIGANGMPEGVMSPDMMFSANMVPGASQIPTMPTFNCDNLAIGTWRRMSTSNTDLSCFYCPVTRIMTWQIIDGASRFKMTFPLDNISRIEHYEVDPMYSQVDFDLLENPQFFMETISEDQQRDWKKCSDFTEGKQATLVTRHTIHGISSALKMQVMSLTIAYPPLQSITHYRETQFPTQFHAYTAPIPQISQFLDPSQYDRRFANQMNAGAYLTLNDGLDSGEGSDIGEDFYEGAGAFGSPFTSTTSALLDMGADGTQPPRFKSRRTASMPTPAINNFLSTGLASIPYHSSPLSMYSTTGVSLDTPTSAAGLLATSTSATSVATAAAVAAAATSAGSTTSSDSLSTSQADTSASSAPVSLNPAATMVTTTPSSMGTSTVAETSGAGLPSSTSSSLTPAPVDTALAPSMIATATTMPKLTITTLSDSIENGGVGTESTTVVHGGNEQDSVKKDLLEDDLEESTQSVNPMGLTSQFNDFLAQAVVSTSAPFMSTGFPAGMMYGMHGHSHTQAFQLGGLDDGSDGGYEFNSGYYGMIPEQASFVSMSDLEGSTGQQTDGEESSYGPY